MQRTDLERAHASVQFKAQELERSSQYKSDFLANMSHELRTPLNSSLILAKLLADNPDENLTQEQVKYARTIQSSGNDLLNLINDILDLSKIEAGHVEIHPEVTPLARLANGLRQLFDPVAQEKKLDFEIKIDAAIPRSFETDPQRLEQILKNLISNAIKFTESGKGRRRRRQDPVLGQRYRHWDFGGTAEKHLRSIPSGGQHDQSPLRRNRTGPVDFTPARAAARWRHPCRKHTRPGQSLHPDASPQTWRCCCGCDSHCSGACRRFASLRTTERRTCAPA
jgi:hypothetical protein